jgi:hypothetical protein
MRVRDMINLLEEYAKRAGDDAQVAVPAMDFDNCRRDTKLFITGIWTILASYGEKVEW